MAKAGGDASLDGFPSFASDLTEGVAEAFDDPPTTLRAIDDPEYVSRKERKLENRTSNQNHLKKLTSFSWAFATAEQF